MRRKACSSFRFSSVFSRSSSSMRRSRGSDDTLPKIHALPIRSNLSSIDLEGPLISPIGLPDRGAIHVRNFAAPLLQEFGHVLSVRQAATVLRLSRASIYKLCDSGKLAHVRI